MADALLKDTLYLTSHALINSQNCARSATRTLKTHAAQALVGCTHTRTRGL